MSSNQINYVLAVATGFALDKLEGRTVRLVVDPLAGERGFYGRLLACVYVDCQDLDGAQVEYGYARVYIEGDRNAEEQYLALQHHAQTYNIDSLVTRPV